MSVRSRPASPEDAGPAGAICYEAFKSIAEHHRFPPDFPTADVAVDLLTYLLSRPNIYGVIAEADDRVVGSNFLWETGAVAGVGPITVDPKAQNSAVGRQLMTAVLERARQQGIGAVRLVQAAYHGRSLALYTRLGFVPREPLVVLQGEALQRSIEGHHVRPATDDDIEAANALCHRVHGHDRAGELQEAIRQGPATVVEHGGRITGYATSIGFLGHAIGEATDDVKALIAAAEAFPGPGFLMPVRNVGVRTRAAPVDTLR